MQLISTFNFLEILTFFSVIEMYIQMSKISNFWLSVLISQIPAYLMFILVSKSTHPVSLVLSSQNAQCFYISAPLYIIMISIYTSSIKITIILTDAYIIHLISWYLNDNNLHRFETGLTSCIEITIIFSYL